MTGRAAGPGKQTFSYLHGPPEHESQHASRDAYQLTKGKVWPLFIARAIAFAAVTPVADAAIVLSISMFSQSQLMRHH